MLFLTNSHQMRHPSSAVPFIARSCIKTWKSHSVEMPAVSSCYLQSPDCDHQTMHFLYLFWYLVRPRLNSVFYFDTMENAAADSFNILNNLSWICLADNSSKTQRVNHWTNFCYFNFANIRLVSCASSYSSKNEFEESNAFSEIFAEEWLFMKTLTFNAAFT